MTSPPASDRVKTQFEERSIGTAMHDSHKDHAIDLDKTQLFSLADTDHSGAISKEEFSKLYDVIHRQTEADVTSTRRAQKKADIASKRLKFFGVLGVLMIIFLAATVAANTAVMLYLLEETKETKASGADGRLTVAGTDKTVKVGSADFNDGALTTGEDHTHIASTAVATITVPLIVAPVLPEELLNELRTLSVTIVDLEVSRPAKQILHVERVTSVNSTYIYFDVKPSGRLVVKNGEAFLRRDLDEMSSDERAASLAFFSGSNATLDETDDEDEELLANLSDQADLQEKDAPRTTRIGGMPQLVPGDAAAGITPRAYQVQYLCSANVTCSSFRVNKRLAGELIASAYAALEMIGLNFSLPDPATRRKLQSLQQANAAANNGIENFDFSSYGITHYNYHNYQHLASYWSFDYSGSYWSWDSYRTKTKNAKGRPVWTQEDTVLAAMITDMDGWYRTVGGYNVQSCRCTSFATHVWYKNRRWKKLKYKYCAEGLMGMYKASAFMTFLGQVGTMDGRSVYEIFDSRMEPSTVGTNPYICGNYDSSGVCTSAASFFASHATAPLTTCWFRMCQCLAKDQWSTGFPFASKAHDEIAPLTVNVAGVGRLRTCPVFSGTLAGLSDCSKCISGSGRRQLSTTTQLIKYSVEEKVTDVVTAFRRVEGDDPATAEEIGGAIGWQFCDCWKTQWYNEPNTVQLSSSDSMTEAEWDEIWSNYADPSNCIGGILHRDGVATSSACTVTSAGSTRISAGPNVVCQADGTGCVYGDYISQFLAHFAGNTQASSTTASNGVVQEPALNAEPVVNQAPVVIEEPVVNREMCGACACDDCIATDLYGTTYDAWCGTKAQGACAVDSMFSSHCRCREPAQGRQLHEMRTEDWLQVARSIQERRKLIEADPANRRQLGKACPNRGSRACHPPHSTVELASGQRVRLDAITVGEAIRTPAGVEPIVGFLHADATAPTDYHIFTTDDSTMAVSAKHWILIDGVEADPARARAGQSLSTPTGSKPIRSIHTETHIGAYHPLTASGSYYVDGVAASTYPAYIPHAAWKVVGDSYVTLRYRLGLPVVHEGAAPVTLFWLLDALAAVGVPDVVQSAVLWPLIAGSVMLTEIISALALAVADKLPGAAKMPGALAASLAAAQILGVKGAAK